MQFVYIDKSILSIVVLPELSNPTISILISFLPTILLNMLLKIDPMNIYVYYNPDLNYTLHNLI